MFRKLFDFFLYSSIYISLCAVMMVYQTAYLFHLPESRPLLFFTFFATICSYNFHWYLTPDFVSPSRRIRWSQENKTLHLGLYFIGLLGAAVSFFLIYRHWFALLVAVGITFLYSAPKVPLPYFRFLRKIAVGKTIFLASVWSYVTTILPVAITATHFGTTLALYALSRFFLIYAICILFDFRDREEDKAAGIRSLITVLNEKAIDRLFIFSIGVFLILTVWLVLSSHLVTPAGMVMLLAPGFLVSVLYNYAKKHFSDLLYYFVLDGLMMLSGLLMLLGSI